MKKDIDTTADFHQFNPRLSGIAAASDKPFVHSSGEMIQYALSFAKELPEEYGWRHMSVEAFRDLASTISTVEDANTIYWLDTLRNFEAYAITVYWRGIEIIKPCIRSLNVHEVVTPAILARSLLELSASFIENTNIAYQTIQKLPPHINNAIEISKDLEKLSLRILFGTRLGTDIPEHLKQKNVLTTLQKLTKNPSATDLLPVYEFLCEIAHPNVIGNAVFWAEVLQKNEDGSETIRIKREHDYDKNSEIIEKVLWSLGWSAVCLRNGFHIIHDAIEMMVKRFPELQKHLRNTG
jgi:hypothetical protein